MVVNAAFIEGTEKHAGQLAHTGPVGSTGHARPAGESDAERAARVQRLAQLVKGGTYNVMADRLAMALLDWDPRRSTPRGSVETAGRRRAYMREYMRRRRATQPASDVPGEAWAPEAPSVSGVSGAFGAAAGSNGEARGLAPPAGAGAAWAAFALASP